MPARGADCYRTVTGWPTSPCALPLRPRRSQLRQTKALLGTGDLAHVPDDVLRGEPLLRRLQQIGYYIRGIGDGEKPFGAKENDD
jgi:hypothetical protein